MRSRLSGRPPRARSGRGSERFGAALAAVLALGGFVACRQPTVEPGSSSLAATPAAAAPVAVSAGASPPASSARPEMLVDWVERAPTRASTWLDGRPAAPALDSARAALALHPDVLVARPDFAAVQASLITDADVRRATLAEVFYTWARIDPAAARRQASAEPSLDLIERTHLDELLASVEPIR